MKKGIENQPTTIDIDNDKTLFDYIGTKEERGEELTAYEKQVKAGFNLKIREIQNFANAKKICPGTALFMINKNYWISWRTIRYGMFDEIMEWFRNNWFRYFQILDPSSHFELMKTKNEYSEWFNQL
jgi:hypothetical protein